MTDYLKQLMENGFEFVTKCTEEELRDLDNFTNDLMSEVRVNARDIVIGRVFRSIDKELRTPEAIEDAVRAYIEDEKKNFMETGKLAGPVRDKVEKIPHPMSETKKQQMMLIVQMQDYVNREMNKRFAQVEGSAFGWKLIIRARVMNKINAFIENPDTTKDLSFLYALADKTIDDLIMQTKDKEYSVEEMNSLFKD